MEKNISYRQYLRALKVVDAYLEQERDHYGKVTRMARVSKSGRSCTKHSLAYDVLSVRLLNVLNCNTEHTGLKICKETTIEDLGNISISMMYKLRNCGARSVNELKDICCFAGVELKP